MTALLDGPLACVDLETTGGNALTHRVIEVGIVLVDGGEVVERYSTLVNPGCRVPRNIEVFTGITTAMLESAPDFAAVADEVLSRLQGRLFVAHNARFDYGFLRSEFRRIDRRLSEQVLCTVKLSRRVDAGERGHGLDAVMARHGLDCSARHRALGDAQVVADFIACLRRREPPDRLQQQVEELVRGPGLPPQLDPGLADELPEGPGTYRFYGADGALLYIGKSKTLRSRVLAHFADEHRSAKELKLTRQVHRVEWQESAGEIGALLSEARQVKELLPLHNRRLRASEACWTLRLEARGEGVAAKVVTLADAAGLESDCHGVFRSRRDAQRALDELLRAHELCPRLLGLEAGEGSCFGAQVGRCRGGCCGREPLALHTARVRMALARHKLKGWPFAGAIGVVERDWKGCEELHVFDQWRYLGTVADTTALAELPGADATDFDLDCYRLLCRILEGGLGPARLIELGKAGS